MQVDISPVAKIHGAFKLTAPDGQDLTPKGIKERGLIALLVFHPEQRRTRAVLQDMLWSESPPDKGSANLRRALSNVRTALKDEAWRLKSDRNSVAFDPKIEITPSDGTVRTLLEDLDIPGTEFERWLNDVRLQEEATGYAEYVPTPVRPTDSYHAPEIRIESSASNQSPEEAFINDQIASSLAERLQTLGDVTIHLDGAHQNPNAAETAETLVSIRTLSSGAEWLVHVRIQALPSLRFLASRHVRVPNSSAAIWNDPAVINLLNSSVRALIDHNSTKASAQPFFAIQNAVRRMYSGDRRLVSTAEALLKSAQNQQLSGLALAWRGFLRLTEVLEFRNNDPALVDEGLQLAEEATTLSPENPVVWALAAQVHIYMGKDLDLGTFCARRSLDCMSDDPYALDAMSTAMDSVGAFQEADEVAQMARKSASGLSNEFTWDMQCCLTALGLGDVDRAISHARAAHYKVPGYRPAVRYLTALNLIKRRIDEASMYVERLRKLEPGLTIDTMESDEYPLYTLRRVGFGEELDFDLLRG